MKKISLYGMIMMLAALVLSGCLGKLAKPVEDYHQQMIDMPDSATVFKAGTGITKAWKVGQYVKYISYFSGGPQVTEMAIVAKDGDNGYWIEMKFVGRAKGYKALLRFPEMKDKKSTEFNLLAYKAEKGEIYQLNAKNEWTKDQQERGVPVTYWFNDKKVVVNLMQFIMGYGTYGIFAKEVRDKKIDVKTKAGTFTQSISQNYSAMINISESRDINFYMHSDVPITGIARFDAFYYNIDVMEIRDDFTGSLFGPYPVNNK